MTENKTLYNCCTNSEEPDWTQFDWLEIGGCCDLHEQCECCGKDFSENELVCAHCGDAKPERDGTMVEGGYTAAEAHFFTVYGHLKEGGVEAITDCDTLDLAYAVANLLARKTGFKIVETC